jgi:hypothetical protein
MDTFLDRPVFPFFIDHGEGWSGNLNYDADVRKVGTMEIPVGQLTHRRKKIDLDCVAESLDSIKEFFETVKGQAIGFWLPLHAQTATINGVASQGLLTLDGEPLTLGGEIVTLGEGGYALWASGTAYVERWQAQYSDLSVKEIDGSTTYPLLCLAIYAPDGNVYYRSITSVSAFNGNSLINLDETQDALPYDLTGQWAMSPLLFVRLASDELEGIERLNYETFTFGCTVLELPFEYGSTESPTAIIRLFQIGYVLGDSSNWEYFTDWGVNVEGTDGTYWSPAPIEVGDITSDADGDTCEVKALPWTDCPFADMFPTADGLPLHIKIWRAKWDWDTAKETGTRQLLFDGIVQSPQDDDLMLTVSCVSGADIYKRSFPCVPKSRTCTAAFCGSKCGLAVANYVCAATVVETGLAASTGYTIIRVKASQTLPAGWLLYGFIASGDYYNSVPSKRWEWRPILDYFGGDCTAGTTYQLVVPTEFRHLAVGDTCYLYHGCAHTTTACKAVKQLDGTLVNNIANYFGEPLTPIKNPQFNTSSTTEAKK